MIVIDEQGKQIGATYPKRAKGLVKNGRAHYAYVYPFKVNKTKGKFYDAYANDQDWGMYFAADFFYN